MDDITNEYNIELLKQLYWIHSPSGYEEGLQGFIRQKLYLMGIPFETDDYNQIYRLDSIDKPLVVAHSDQVKHKPLSILTETNKKIYGNSNLGADDKNGIWIILNLLIEYPDLNFIFSTEEEIGGNIKNLLYTEEENLYNIPYCLVFDRKGKSDIVGASNDYCSMAFDNDVEKIGKSYGFKSSWGAWSDCDELREYINCCNISCGYYQAHTIKEYTVKKDLINALEFGKSIIDNIAEYYIVEDFEDDFKSHNSHNSYNKYDYGYYRELDYVEGDDCPYCDSILDRWDISTGFCTACNYDLLEEWNKTTVLYSDDYNNTKDN